MKKCWWLWCLAVLAAIPLGVGVYDGCRTVLWVGSIDLEIESVVSDASTGQPIPNALVEVDSEGGLYADSKRSRFHLQTDEVGIARRLCRSCRCSGRQSNLRFTDIFSVALPCWRV